jgi:N-acetylmuramic acid 6-phosphate etherase
VTTSAESKEDLASLSTEQRLPRSTNIDRLATADILRLINSEDKLVPAAVERELPYISEAVELIVPCLKNGGRLIYVGAGTSGRLGILDASECPPTFGTDPDSILGVIAGGQAAVFRSQEGAEDNVAKAIEEMNRLEVSVKDVVCGIAASRRTPYVVSAIGRARERGAKTVYITTNPRATFDLQVDVAICPEVGPEVITGSTRMKSGTAQKLVLNMLTTATMVKLGKLYENMMVDLQLTNHKLVERAKRTIMIVTGLNEEHAARLLQESGGHVKTAIVMGARGVTAERAKQLLEEAGGFVRNAIGT